MGSSPLTRGFYYMKVPYKIITLTELMEVSKGLDRIFLDTETIGLYGKIRLVQAYHPTWEEVLIVEYPEPVLFAAWIRVVPSAWHNAHYDISTIQKQSNMRILPVDYEDTFLLSRLHYYTQESFSLDSVFSYTYQNDPYVQQGMDKKALQKSEWEGDLTDEQYRYAATDVYFMPDMYNAVKDQLDSTSYKLDKLILNYCLDFQNNGIPTDQCRIKDRMRANTERVEELDLPINANSWKQVREYLDTDKSDALALTQLYLLGGENAGKARKVKETRKLLKQNNFLSKFLNQERIYGLFKPSARSGRLTSNNQNLQQIPRDLKGMFTAPPGRVFVVADYSQLELREACAITNEKNMDRVFRKGGDIHRFTASYLFSGAIEEEERYVGKTCNFNLLYGGSWGMLGKIMLMQADVWLPDDKLILHTRKWKNLYPSIKQWQEKNISDWRNGKPGVTPFGRRYIGKRMTDQMNIEVSGGASEVTKLALHYMYNKITSLPGNAIVINFVHDEYVIEMDDNEECYKVVAQIIAESMQEAWKEGTATLPIPDLPMPVDVQVGVNLGDMKKPEGVMYEYKAA